MWSLVILIVGTLPPQGFVLNGFENKAACVAESWQYCRDDSRFRCKCEEAREP